jgi:hypothetical protein
MTQAKARSGGSLGITNQAADGCIRWTLVLFLLLAVLVVSRDMPSRSASGLELLAMKLRWSVAWGNLEVQPIPRIIVSLRNALS